MIANIFEFALFPKMVKNGYYWSKMVQYGSKITKNMKMAKIVQNNYICHTLLLFSETYFSQIEIFLSQSNIKTHRENCKTLPREHLIGCQMCQVVLTLSAKKVLRKC